MKRFWSVPYRFAAVFTAVAVLFSAFVLLDAFVIPHAYQSVQVTQEDVSGADAGSVDQTENETSTSDDVALSSEKIVTDTQYQDESVSVTVTTVRQWNTTIYVADIVLSDPSDLTTAFAQNTYGRNIKQTTSDIADEAGAVFAINGDYYGFRSSGYVIRNGVLYRDTAASASQEDLVVYTDGSFAVIREGDVTAAELLAAGAWQVFSFGPGLVIDGSVAVSEGDEVAQSMISNPRTAIGMIEPGHYVAVVSDGRTSESEGLTLYQLAQFMQAQGCVVAYNLDGGGSSTMYLNGSVINVPVGGRSSGERKVSDIVCICG